MAPVSILIHTKIDDWNMKCDQICCDSETCDLVLIHHIRRLVFLLGSGRTQSVQKNNSLPSRKTKTLLNFPSFSTIFSPRVGAFLCRRFGRRRVFVHLLTDRIERHGALNNFRWSHGVGGEPHAISGSLSLRIQNLP